MYNPLIVIVGFYQFILHVLCFDFYDLIKNDSTDGCLHFDVSTLMIAPITCLHHDATWRV